jgi:hypothetical protein
MSRLERMLKEEGTVIRSTVDFTSLSFRCIAVDDVRSLFFPCFKLPLSTYLWHPVLSLYASSIFLFI